MTNDRAKPVMQMKRPFRLGNMRFCHSHIVFYLAAEFNSITVVIDGFFLILHLFKIRLTFLLGEFNFLFMQKYRHFPYTFKLVMQIMQVLRSFSFIFSSY